MKKIIKFTTLICLSIIFLGSIHIVHAQEDGVWKFKKILSNKRLCKADDYCFEPKSHIDGSSAEVSWGRKGIDHEDNSETLCKFNVKGSWNTPPEELVVGDKLTINENVEALAIETPTCQNLNYYGEKLDSVSRNEFGMMLSVHAADASYTYADESPERMLEDVVPDKGNIDEDKFGTFNKPKTYSNNFDITIPKAKEAGDKLYLRYDFGVFRPLLMTQATYMYEYEGKMKTEQSVKKDEPEKEEGWCPISLDFDNSESRASLKSSNKINEKVLSLLEIIPLTYAKDSGARFTDFSGEVTVAPGHDLEDVVPAEMDMVLAVGDHIKTEIESNAIIGFSDMTTFCMGPLSSIILDTPPEKESKLSILAGKILMNFKKMYKDGTMDVKMNQAVAGIKGTTVEFEETDKESIIKVFHGSVEFTSTVTGEKAMVNDGEMITASPEGLSEKTKFNIDEEAKQWGKPPYKKTNHASWIFIVLLIVIVLVIAIFVRRDKVQVKK